MLFDVLVLFSFLICLLLLKRLVNVYPSLMACMLRCKECFNLEASVKLARDRNIVSLAMMMPFCLVAYRYRLYSPDFFGIFDGNVVLGLYFAIFCLYIILRVIVAALFRPRAMQPKIYEAADKAAFTFFNILTLVLLAAGGIMSLIDVSDMVIKDTMLWTSAGIYVLFLLRKTQIFMSSCSVFAAFLYLCALELVPTGILVVSAMIF